jgi:hypothetical protein
MVTGELAKLLIETGASSAAARQRIARAGKGIHVLDRLPLPRNARFIYLAEQYGSPRFWTALIECLNEMPGAYGHALAAIKARGGIIPEAHFTIATGLPVQMSRRLAADEVSGRLETAGLLQRVTVSGVGPCLAFSKDLPYLQDPASDMIARLIAERILLQALETWGKRLAIGSFNKFELRDENVEQPRVGAFQFDITAPSYLLGLAKRVKGKPPIPGFMICDVLLNGELALEGIKPFIRKCQTLALGKNMPRCLPIFVADRYKPDALNAARSAGIIPATTEALFGEAIAKALKELTNTLKAAADRALDPEKFAKMFDTLSSFEGVAGTLRGALFEFVSRDIAQKGLHARTTMNITIREGGKDAAEIDVQAVVENHCVHFIECKGISPNSFVDADEVERWLHKRIPTIREWALQNPEFRRLPMSFELWSTGDLTPETRAAVEQARRDTRKYEIRWRGPAEIEELTESTRDQALLKVMRQHFLRCN